MSFALIQQIMADISTINAAKAHRACEKCGKAEPKEKPIGTLHDEDTRKLWVLMDIYQSRTLKALMKLRDPEEDLATDEQKQEVMAEVERTGQLLELTHTIFWAQVRETMGLWAVKDVDPNSLGLRSGWMIVERPGKLDALESLLGAIGFAAPVSAYRVHMGGRRGRQSDDVH